MEGCDVACVYPNNGLVVPSVVGGPKENRYVLPAHAIRYPRMRIARGR